MKTASNHELQILEGEELERIGKDVGVTPDGLALLTPGRWLYPGAFKYIVDKVYNFEWRKTDIVLMGAPKTGTTWMQEILWTMVKNPDLNHPDASLPILARIPIIDGDMFYNPNTFKGQELDPESDLAKNVKTFKERYPDKDPYDGIFIQAAEAQPDPRIMKTHYPLSLLHPKFLDTVKCVYISRNPRDELVSFYHMMKTFELFNYTGTFDDFVERVIRGEIIYTPIDGAVNEAWNMRNHPNFHFVFYEDLKANTIEELKKVDKFIGTNLTDEQLQNVKHHTSFEQMKARDSFAFVDKTENPKKRDEVKEEDTGFFRKGIVGDWKGGLSPENVAKIQKWTEEKMSDIPFKYKI